jgi:NAD+-dependent secondary alcohol dehydrogenase Adh1
MKAVRVHAYGETPVLDDVPEPRISGPFDVIVEIGGAGLCRTDLHIVAGQMAERYGVTLPYTIGHENAGWVREIGSAVTNLAPGDPVILHPQMSCGLCLPCRAGQDMHCESPRFPGLDSDGGMAEYLLTSARACVKLDPELRPRDVAALADAGITAYHAVKKAQPLLPPGTYAVVIGAGGLGHIGVQCLAAMTPARILAVDRSEEALALATRLGAHHAIHAAGDPAQAVLDHTGGRGAHVVIEFVGENGTEEQGVRMLRRAGSYFVVGYGGAVSVPTLDIIATEINIVGNLVGTYGDLAELMALAAQGSVRLHTETYPLDDIGDAIADLDGGRLRGRGILVPGR